VDSFEPDPKRKLPLVRFGEDIVDADPTEKVALIRFAKVIGVSRNTARRLFQRNVFPDDWVEETPGGKWFVWVNPERIETAKANYRIWKVYARKPEAAKSLPDDDSIGTLVVDLLEIRILRKSADARTYYEFAQLFCSNRGYAEFNKLQGQLNQLSESPEGCAMILIAKALLEFKKHFNSFDLEPSAKELAELLDTSVASLYRKPYGKGSIKAARKWLSGQLQAGSVSDLETLTERLMRVPTIDEIRAELICSESRALDLLEAMESTPLDPISLPEEFLTSADGFSTKSQPFSRDLTDGEKELKRSRDNARTSQENQFVPVWSLSEDNDKTLFLNAEPKRARETVTEFRDGKKNVSERELKWAFRKIKERKTPLGCLMQFGPSYTSRIFHPQKICDDNHLHLDLALKALIRKCFAIAPLKDSTLYADHEKLLKEGIKLWELTSEEVDLLNIEYRELQD